MKTNEVIFIVDPFQAPDKQSRQFLENWNKFGKTRTALKDKKWLVSEASYGHVKQTDAFSCGVFVCYIFEQLVNKTHEKLKERFNLNDYRQ